MRFSPNDSPNILAFGEIKLLRKFEGYYDIARQFSTGIPSALNPHSSIRKTRENEYVRCKQATDSLLTHAARC